MIIEQLVRDCIMLLTLSVWGGLPLSRDVPQPVITPWSQTLAKLATGPYVNFESAPIKAIAYSPESHLLVLANTPNNSLAVYNASSVIPYLDREFFVGLDPVSLVFQPGTAGQIVWVVNRISDTAVRANIGVGIVEAVVQLSDAPVNIVSDDTGDHVYVVEYGYASQRLTVIETTDNTVVSSVHIDCETPMAAVYDPYSEIVYVASHLSGNNTTVVGGEFRVKMNEEPGQDFLATTIDAIAGFSMTRDLFDASELSPLLPVSATGEQSPITARIVADRGQGGTWQALLDVLVEPDGTPRADIVKEFEYEYAERLGQPIANAEALFRRMHEEYIDTNDCDVQAIDVSDPHAPIALGIASNVGTILTGMTTHPVSGELWVSNYEALNLKVYEPNLKGHFADHRITRINTAIAEQPVSLPPFDLHGHILNFNDVDSWNPAAHAGSLANPTDIVFNESGSRAYVAALGPGRVGVLNGSTMAVLDVVDVDRGTRSLAVNDDNDLLYAFNRTDHSISIVDISDDDLQVMATITVNNPEPDHVKLGRNFLYSTEFSHNNASSCAMCHVDGHLDRLAWDLGDPSQATMLPAPYFPDDETIEDPCLPSMIGPTQMHPVKGPFVTQSLRGLKGHEPFHWRGDRPTLQDFNPAFSSLLGGSELSDADMNMFAHFVNTIVYSPNNAYLTRNLEPREGVFALEGLQLFTDLECMLCHEPEHDGAMRTDCFEAGDLGNFVNSPAKDTQLLVTQLRGLTTKGDGLQSGFGLMHDGAMTKFSDTDSALESFVREGFIVTSKDAKLLAAFLRAFPTNVMPVVGWQVLLRSPAVESSSLWTMLQQHHAEPSRCDVVLKHYMGSHVDGYYYNGALAFVDPSGVIVELSELVDLPVSASNPLMIVAVPPGSGQRIATGD